MLPKPENQADLLPPFVRIGEPGWDTKLQQVLQLYEVPLPEATREDEIRQGEAVLGRPFPDPVRAFLITFGPVDFDGLRICTPTEIEWLENVWFRSHLSHNQQQQLGSMIRVADTGSDDVYALDLRDGRCCRCGHDPGGFFDWLPSFDDLIRMAVIDLSWSYYGWPDREVEAMAAQLKSELFWPDRLD